MKKIILMIMIAAALAGCGKKKDLQFCSQKDLKGEGADCGVEFYEGDLMALIRAPEPFGVKSLDVQVFEETKGKPEKIDSISLEVKAEDQNATANLSFYREGRYRVKVMKKDEQIAEGEVAIVDAMKAPTGPK